MKTISLLITIFALAFTSCTKEETAMPADVAYYTCTMHPSVRSKDPNAKCPICGMSLVPVKKSTATNSSELAAIARKSSTHRRASIHHHCARTCSLRILRSRRTPTTHRRHLHQRGNAPARMQIRTPGIVAYDKQRHWDYVSRVDGYVQKLHVSSRGDVVEKDQPLLTIYSPDLLVAQGEYVNALRSRDTRANPAQPTSRNPPNACFNPRAND